MIQMKKKNTIHSFYVIFISFKIKCSTQQIFGTILICFLFLF